MNPVHLNRFFFKECPQSNNDENGYNEMQFTHSRKGTENGVQINMDEYRSQRTMELFED